MKENSFSTVAAISDIAGQVDDILRRSSERLDSDRIERLKKVQAKVEELRSRGLLRPKEFVVITTSDFERKYMVKGTSNQVQL
jgi:hypothetical protein